jgi:Putative esterase
MDSIGRPWAAPLRGQLVQTTIESEALRGNPLGDPHARPLWVYLPPGYDDGDRRYPAVYQIQGLTGQVDMWANRSPFRASMLERIDELFAAGDPPPCLVVFVDCWTSLGGSQYVDSPGTGRYHTYLCDEVVPFVDAGFRTIAGPEGRAIAGKSSGGYGAMITPMLRPDLFGGLATHAGDALFECCYQPEFAASVRYLRDHYDGSYERFWDDFRSRTAFTRAGDEELLNTWCMAACYSTDPDGTVRLPFDPATGRLDPEVWERWLEYDPCAVCARSTSMPAPATSGTSTWAPRRSAANWPRSASTTSSSSSSTRPTWASSTATRSRFATWPSGCRHDYQVPGTI